MTNEQKLQVKDALMRYIAAFDTQAEAAASLQGVTPAVISQVKNDNWHMLGDRLWLHIARQVGFYCGEWHSADTSASLLLRILLGDAQHYAMAYGIAMSSGLGKTFTAARYMHEHNNVLYISCSEEHNRKSFIANVMRTAGVNNPTGTLAEMINTFTTLISAIGEPLVIFDDAHKLKDRVFQLIITLANSLTGIAGVVVMGTDKLRTRITDGIGAQKTGYDRMYNSFGRRFITLGTLSPRDVELVCRANNVHDDHAIQQIAESCNGSMHGIPSLLVRHQMNAAA